MAREKVTITLNREKAQMARALTEAPSTSDVIDLALDRLIGAERIRRDVAAYIQTPPTAGEMALADAARVDLGDDTDWEAMFPDDLA